MAIVRRKGKDGTGYQVKIIGADGRWITETVHTKAEAEQREAELKLMKLKGGLVTNMARQLTVEQYFHEWHREAKGGSASEGWRRAQAQIYWHYVHPVIGRVKLKEVTPAHAARVLARVQELGRGPSQRLHVYNVMHKMFDDAVELYEMMDRNPIIKKIRPKVPMREMPYLEVDDLVKLLRFVRGRPYETAIYLQVFAGLRVGEVQYLRWQHVDLKNGIIHVQGTYVRRENRFQDFPKGKRWHRVKMPRELWQHLAQVRESTSSDFVAVSPKGPWLVYIGYCKALQRYCRQAGVPVISTHGLRHSSSELYMSAGASRDDLRILFAHSSSSVTDRYVHDKGRRLDQVADNVVLLGLGEDG